MHEPVGVASEEIDEDDVKGRLAVWLADVRPVAVVLGDVEAVWDKVCVPDPVDVRVDVCVGELQ